MSELTWTTEKSKKSGFYFYRQSGDEDPIVLRVEREVDRMGSDRLVWLHGDNAPEQLEQCHGDWAGPLEPRRHEASMALMAPVRARRYLAVAGLVPARVEDAGMTWTIRKPIR